MSTDLNLFNEICKNIFAVDHHIDVADVARKRMRETPVVDKPHTLFGLVRKRMSVAVNHAIRAKFFRTVNEVERGMKPMPVNNKKFYVFNLGDSLLGQRGNVAISFNRDNFIEHGRLVRKTCFKPVQTVSRKKNIIGFFHNAAIPLGNYGVMQIRKSKNRFHF